MENRDTHYSPIGHVSPRIGTGVPGHPLFGAHVHNKRGLLESETLSMPGYGVASWTIGHVWNANGHAASLSYPDLGAVDYLPNGLGQPTKVGTFASGVSWHPNGAIAGFTYGNGIVHSQSQTTRGLPQVREDTGALQDHYAWDGNGNVAAITDQRIAPPRSRRNGVRYFPIVYRK